MKILSNASLSTMSPRDLIFDGSYWVTRQLMGLVFTLTFLLSPFFLWILGVIRLRGLLHLFIFQWNSPEFLAFVVQVAIYAIGILAFWHMIQVVTRLDVETAIADRVNHAAEREIKRIRGSSQETIEIEHVPHLWPKNPTPGLASIRMCQSIHIDAMDSQFGSKESMLEHYREESLSGLMNLQQLQRSALHLGILGTFLGLLFAMPQLVQFGNDSFDASIFQKLFASLEVCFATSVAGLVVSLSIGAALSHLVRQHAVFSERLEEAAQSMLVVVRNALNRSQIANTLGQLSDSMREHKDLMVAQNERISQQSEVISGGLGKLHVAREDLDSFLDAVEKIRQKVVGDLGNVTEKIGTAFEAQVTQATENARKVNNAYAGLEDQIRDSSVAITREIQETLQAETNRIISERRSLQAEMQRLQSAQEEYRSQHQDLINAVEVNHTRLATTLENHGNGEQLVSTIKAGNERAEKVLVHCFKELIKRVQANGPTVPQGSRWLRWPRRWKRRE